MKLLPHQLPAVKWANERSRIALFMEMRLGKTIVTMRWARHHGFKRVLLVAPWNTLVGTRNWEGELARDGQRTTMLCLTKKEDRVSQSMWTWTRELVTAPAGYDDGFARTGDTIAGGRMLRRPATGWFLIHYEGLKVTPELLDLKWDAIIVDESTRIRNPQAGITKLLLDATAEHRAILTGLPNPESPLDYFTQFQFLLGDFMGWDNYWAFRQRYFTQGKLSWQWYPKRQTRQVMKEFVHANAYVLTRAAAKVGSKKVYEMRSVPMGRKQEQAIREIAKTYAYEGEETKWAPVVHTWMQKIAGGFHPTGRRTVSWRQGKLRAVRTPLLLDPGKPKLLHELVTEEFKRESVVVWYRFNHEIDFCYAYLKKRKVSVERVHGGLDIPKSERSVIQDRFQDGKTRVLLMQVALGQFGWDLSRANTVMYYSNTYEFEDRSQSEDRAIHPKKTDPVLYIDLVTIGSSDEDVVDALQDKKRNARMFATQMASAIVARLRKILRVTPGDRL